MAEIPVEKKKSGAWWIWALLALLLAAALIWWATDEDEVESAALAPVATTEVAAAAPPAGAVAPVDSMAGLPEPVAQSGEKSIAAILGNPAAYVGQDFSGEVQVAGVPTDRAFWVEDQGARLLALLVDAPEETPVDISNGQQLRIAQGTLRDASNIASLPGKPLDDDTMKLLREQSIFLVVQDEAVRKLGSAA